MRPSRRLAAGLAGLALLGGFAAALFARRGAGTEPNAFVEARLVALNAQLAQVPGRYRLLVGDSHAERLYLPVLCGEPLVDAGLGGIRIAGVRRLAEGLALPRPPAAVIVMAGTNDLARRRGPSEAAVRETFRAEARALLTGLKARATEVFLTPLPPLDPARAADGFAVAERPLYTAILAEECAASDCRMADVFPGDAARSPDGVHVATEDMVGPDGVAARVARAVCPS